MAPIIIKNCLEIGANLGQREVIMSSQISHFLVSLRQLPSGSKIALFLLTWLLLWLPIGFIVGKKLDWQPFAPLNSAKKIPLLVPLYLLVPFLSWLVFMVEGTSLREYGLELDSGVLISVCQGIVLGLGGLGVVFVLEWGLGWLKWYPENLVELVKIVLPILGLALWISVTEELVFRGIFQTILEQDYNKWISAAIVSAVFALLHLLWERKETIPQLPGLWLMGMVLVIARWTDGGSLGLACGLHAGWVFGLSSLDAAQLISYTGQGKDWIVGIYKQPLAGILGVFCLLGTGVVLSISKFK